MLFGKENYGEAHFQTGSKMAFNYFDSWVEFFFFVLLVIGFITALFAPSAVVSYTVIFVSGMIGGRLIYERKEKLKFPYYLIVIGFLVGYAIGAYYGNKSVIITLFVLGNIVSYYLYDKGIVHDIRY